MGRKKNLWGRTYDGIHQISFLINESGTIMQVFDKFKIKDHHQMIIDYLRSL